MEGGNEMEYEVGGVHHVLYRCSTSHPHQALRKRVLERGGCRDGRVFPYLAHYLATGDMLYPEHEGEIMVGRLLQEVTRLDIVNQLLHPHTSTITSCIPRPHIVNSKSEDKGIVNVGDGTLKVHTRRKPRLSLPAIFTNLIPQQQQQTQLRPPPVYRPPPNKGTTVVVVSGRGESCGNIGLDVYAAPVILSSLIPTNTQIQQQNSQSSHTRLSIPPHQFLSTLADKGYYPTVRSWWVCEVTSAVVTQWLVYRRGRRRGKSVVRPTLSSCTASAALSLSSTALSFSSTLRRASSTSHLSFISHLSSSSSHLSSASASSSSRAESEGGKEENEERERLLEDKKPREGSLQERGRERFKNLGKGEGRKTSEKIIDKDGMAEEPRNVEEKEGGEREVRVGGGTLKNRLKTRSKSIMSLATDHSTKPTLTLKRLLNVLL